MSGKFHCFAVSDLFSSREIPGQKDIFPMWRRNWEYYVEKKELNGNTGIVIFGPSQDNMLKIFLDNPVYKILYQSKKCVNPNHKSTEGRNTVVIFEEKKWMKN